VASTSIRLFLQARLTGLANRCIRPIRRAGDFGGLQATTDLNGDRLKPADGEGRVEATSF
jgi:hypothetical protein